MRPVRVVTDATFDQMGPGVSQFVPPNQVVMFYVRSKWFAGPLWQTVPMDQSLGCSFLTFLGLNLVSKIETGTGTMAEMTEMAETTEMGVIVKSA